MVRATADRVLCLHEAAHAVTSEVFRPGSVIGIQMDCVPNEPTHFGGYVFGDGIRAICEWDLWPTDDPDYRVAVAAGREGELLEEHLERFDWFDQKELDRVAGSKQRKAARRRAKSLVRKHELSIRRVAAALSKRRALTGEEVWELMA